jgi:hypothetical protein
MRKLKTVAATLGLLGGVLFPGAAALFQLGAGLTQVERMHARIGANLAANVETEMVGVYEVDPATNEPGLRIREVQVHRE